ncbi:MAG: S49 family peptidase, partial [Candidatus Krumholzibacteria bacterium]|nr:S49 family peptidase [Candidatus Krumholzibacteria bacterium]
ALRDDDVVAIILRVDSGGGESLASDLMGHMVEQASRQKPVIVSMVDVAASGGYMMSYRASHIMADEMTITGSIGSISGKFDMSGFNRKIGLGHSHVSAGPNARFMSDDEPFTAEEFALYEANHMVDFQRWIDDVARARQMSVAEVEELAMGRVFTGRQAVANGLIDEVGGLYEAVAAARRLADIEADEELSLWHLPAEQGLIQTVLGGPEEELSAAGRWLLYTNIKQDLEMVRHSLVSENWQTINPIFTD